MADARFQLYMQYDDASTRKHIPVNTYHEFAMREVSVNSTSLHETN